MIQENLKVCGRIKQNINLLDLEDKSDDDETFEPPKGILTVLILFMYRLFFQGLKLYSSGEIRVTRGMMDKSVDDPASDEIPQSEG